MPLRTLISAHPEPALPTVTVPPLTCRCPGTAKLSVCTGPGFPDEYTHRYDSFPGPVSVTVPL